LTFSGYFTAVSLDCEITSESEEGLLPLEFRLAFLLLGDELLRSPDEAFLDNFKDSIMSRKLGYPSPECPCDLG
jgi:hypothetical protein